MLGSTPTVPPCFSASFFSYVLLPAPSLDGLPMPVMNRDTAFLFPLYSGFLAGLASLLPFPPNLALSFEPFSFSASLFSLVTSPIDFFDK